MRYFLLILNFIAMTAFAQKNYWQQHADYTMEVAMDVTTYQYTGTQTIVYTNNSDDALQKVYYHLYPNAFMPGSDMDARLHTIKDPDPRMATKEVVNKQTIFKSRIASLKPNEIGYLKVKNFRQNGVLLQTKTIGTILEVVLNEPIKPNSKCTLSLDFDGQLPVQIRRSGRNNSEGVALSMSQWYPKIAEFDAEGWHADPYIAREFHGVWANFDVKITLDKNYTIGASGYLQNPNQVGHGYQTAGTIIKNPKKTKNLTWHYVAPMVHDFTWAADPDYLHDIVEGPNQVALHFLYKNKPQTIENWKKMQPLMVRVMDLFNKKIGNYPYKQYSFIQAGDGGMEYAMCTLMLGDGTLEGILGTATHELGHSWFQHVLATNESKHPWMDEGFTSYIEDWVLNEIAETKSQNPFVGSYKAYFSLVKSGKEQPLSTHGDRFDENKSYAIASYAKGSIFLSQLEYLIGKENLDATLKKYYFDFQFKHPTPNDFKRTAERVSGAHLDWYLTDWTLTTNTIDYKIKEVVPNTNSTKIILERVGRMPMPIDLLVEFSDGSLESFYIPLQLMYFEKENPTPEITRTILPYWSWAASTFSFDIPSTDKKIKKITIDPSGLMADIKGEGNVFEVK